jgi:cell division protein FtsW
MDPTRGVRIRLFCITLVLVALGVVMIYSASAVYADERYGDSMYFLKRHLVALAIGIGAAVATMLVDYRRLRRWAVPALVLSAASLALMFVPGVAREAGGAQRWFPVLGFHIQPSEFAKAVLILYLAHAVAAKESEINDWKGTLLPLGAATGVVIGLTLLQPDLGTAASMGCIFLLLLFAGGMRLRYFLALFGAALVAFTAAVAAKPYRLQRVSSFLRPWEDLRGAGFQLWQSFLALGSGGLVGVGLGQSQQKLFYLPAAHTDFIFSIIGEELGFLGAGLVILLFAMLVFTGFTVSLRCMDRFGQLFSLGLVALIGMEAIINIGVSIGAFPTKGLALPFVSYGGSSLIVKLACVGFLLNISRDAGPRPAGPGAPAGVLRRVRRPHAAAERPVP